ncbi:hypothetical protein Daesc_003746 [Daldinia eschscholtzii]|uniref:Dienelactone hydrolase n=1 Tax=Daldinia eschscholtzii TaxID=292717 RepID=A0AAX6MMR6_9PEZI
MPNRGNGNVGIISSNLGPNHNDPGFLSSDFPHSAPKLYITAESDEFDLVTLSEWKDEGFNVEYIPMGDGGNEYRMKLESLSRTNLGPCETYGIIAYGDAASFCLEHFHILDNNPEFKLCCLIAYYPTRIPDTRTKFPGGIHVLVHLTTGEEVGIVKQTQMVGIQGKKRTVNRKIDRGIGAGGTMQVSYPSYTYNAVPGFAEHDLDEFDRVSAELSWSRSLATARRAFRRDVDLEKVLEQNIERAIGSEELQRFYSEFFIDKNPQSIKLTLLSRTIGSDRVVDELHVAFKHTQDMPWILPGVPSTNKKVEILVVSIVTLRGGKLYHEHIYWDQASVLVQVGLLDPKAVPRNASDSGVKRLPVIGRRAARSVLVGYDESDEGEATNELIPEWDDEADDDVGSTAGEGDKRNDAKTKETEEDENKKKKRDGLEKEEPEQSTPSQEKHEDAKVDGD